MTLRVTQGMMSHRQLTDVARATARLAQASEVASSQQRINRPSDDATGTARALALRDRMAAVAGHRDAADAATAMLDVADTALQGMSDALSRARELAVRGASGTTAPSDRAAMALELESIIAAVKDLAGARTAEGFVFAGTATATRPYAAGSDAYAGNDGVVAQAVGPGVSLRANPVTGADLLGSGGADGKLLSVLRTLQSHLAGGDAGALGSTDLVALEGARDRLAVAQAAVGSGQQRASAATTRLTEAGDAMAKQLTGLEDADLAASLTRLTQQQQALQAALKATGALAGLSLMDFVR